MKKQIDGYELWDSIKKVITASLSIIITIAIWVVLFVSILTGYFSIILIIVVIYLAIREHFEKPEDRDKDYYRDSVEDKKK